MFGIAFWLCFIVNRWLVIGDASQHLPKFFLPILCSSLFTKVFTVWYNPLLFWCMYIYHRVYRLRSNKSLCSFYCITLSINTNMINIYTLWYLYYYLGITSSSHWRIVLMLSWFCKVQNIVTYIIDSNQLLLYNWDIFCTKYNIVVLL